MLVFVRSFRFPMGVSKRGRRNCKGALPRTDEVGEAVEGGEEFGETGGANRVTEAGGSVG